MKKLLLAAAISALCASAFAQGKDLKVAIDATYEPFTFKTSDGKPTGFDVDIASALCEQIKRKCVFVEQAWDGMIPGLMAKKYDVIISSMSITEERKAKVDFTNKYYASPVVLIAKTGSPLRPELASLKGRKVAVQRGTVSDNFATKYWAGKGVEIVRYAKQDEAYLDHKSGRVDATFADYWEAYGGFLTKPEGSGSVSYTHLTLPTSDLV